MSFEVVEAREQAGLGEHAHAGDEGEADMLRAALDDAVEPAQVVAVGCREFRVVQHVQDRLVVLVHEDGHLLPRCVMQATQNVPQAPGTRIGCRSRGEIMLTLDRLKLLDDVPLDLSRFIVLPVEAQAHHRMADRPVPVPVDVQAPEQLLVPLEKRSQSVQQEALAEPSGTGQEVEAPFVHQLPDERGLVDIVEVLLPDRAEVLDPDRQVAGHGSLRSWPAEPFADLAQPYQETRAYAMPARSGTPRSTGEGEAAGRPLNDAVRPGVRHRRLPDQPGPSPFPPKGASSAGLNRLP